MVLKKFAKKLYGYWIIFGNTLGTINAFIIMTLVYFLIIGPISIFLKIFRVDVLYRRRPDKTNWHPIEKVGTDINAYQRLS